MRLDLRFRLAREQGQPAQRGVHGFPMRRALLRGVIAAACGRRTGCGGRCVARRRAFSPVTADLVDVPFFNAARTTWGGLHASTAAPLDVAHVACVGRVSRADGRRTRRPRGALRCLRGLPRAVRRGARAVERAYASRFDYGLASALPVTGGFRRVRTASRRSCRRRAVHVRASRARRAGRRDRRQPARVAGARRSAGRHCRAGHPPARRSH